MSFPCFDDFEVYGIEEIDRAVIGSSADISTSFHDLVAIDGRYL